MYCMSAQPRTNNEHMSSDSYSRKRDRFHDKIAANYSNDQQLMVRQQKSENVTLAIVISTNHKLLQAVFL